MKAALIAPRGYHHTVAASTYHLTLAQIDDASYKDVYSLIIDRDDCFVIMDNGAAEGEMVSTEKLFDKAWTFNADEVVVPDVIKDMRSTLARVGQFMTNSDKPTMGYMLVVQGTTWKEVTTCIDTYLEEYPYCTIGIPRHLLTTLQDKNARCKLVEYIGGRGVIHMLGTNPAAPKEVRLLGQKFGDVVRGIDSSLPYNYTAAGLELSKCTPHDDVQRPTGYFGRPIELDDSLLQDNIQTFLDWASGA